MEFYPVNQLNKGFVSVMPMPGKTGNLEADLKELSAKGVQVIVSLLEIPEAERLGLAKEAPLAQKYGLEFLNFPIVDHHLPEDQNLAFAFLQKLEERLQEGKHIVLHCKGGTGRTGTFAGALFKRAGWKKEEIFTLLSKARGKKMPATEEQMAWALHC